MAAGSFSPWRKMQQNKDYKFNVLTGKMLFSRQTSPPIITYCGKVSLCFSPCFSLLPFMHRAAETQLTCRTALSGSHEQQSLWLWMQNSQLWLHYGKRAAQDMASSQWTQNCRGKKGNKCVTNAAVLPARQNDSLAVRHLSVVKFLAGISKYRAITLPQSTSLSEQFRAAGSAGVNVTWLFKKWQRELLIVCTKTDRAAAVTFNGITDWFLSATTWLGLFLKAGQCSPSWCFTLNGCQPLSFWECFTVCLRIRMIPSKVSKNTRRAFRGCSSATPLEPGGYF